VPSLISIVDDILNTEDPRADYAASYANAAWVLRANMQVLAKCKIADWADELVISGWVRKTVEKWSWSEVALEGAVALVGLRQVVFRRSPIICGIKYLTFFQHCSSHSNYQQRAQLASRFASLSLARTSTERTSTPRIESH
jgi:hypothetical protein